MNKPQATSNATPALNTSDLKIQRAAMSESSSASLGLYGPAKSGKTEVVISLVKAGFEVHYLDFDQNVQSILSIANEPNFHYYSISDGVGGGICDYMRELRTKHSALACVQHGMLNCPTCANAGEGFTHLRLKDLTAKCIVVFDSFTAVQESIVSKAMLVNRIQDLKADQIDMSFHMAVANVSQPLWNFINKLPSVAHSLIITHQVDKQNLMNSDKVSSFVHPLAGSGTYSLSDKPKRASTALWKTSCTSVLANRKPKCKAGADFYASSPDASTYEAMLLGDAVVEFFSK